MNTATNAPAPGRPNFYRDACSICGTHVAAKAGFYVGKLPSGQYDIRCAPHRDAVRAAGTHPSASVGPREDGRPVVSARTFDAALSLFRRCDADGDPTAREIMGEIVDALAWIRGERPATSGVPVARITSVATAHRKAADDLVASILGTPAAADDDATAAADLSDCEAAFADAPSRAPDVSAERANRDADRRVAAGKPRAAKGKGGKAANPFAHRCKQ